MLVSAVKITVNTAVDGEVYELVTFGQYYQKGASKYLQYEESIPEGTIRTTVKLNNEEVLILRKGAVDMRLHLVLNKKTPGTYHTPLGLLMTEADTKQIEIAEGRVKVRYDLTIQGSHAGTYEMNINYRTDQEVQE
nr:DUF1934 domain-containing protein [Bacillus sp. B15-48]